MPVDKWLKSKMRKMYGSGNLRHRPLEQIEENIDLARAALRAAKKWSIKAAKLERKRCRKHHTKQR